MSAHAPTGAGRNGRWALGWAGSAALGGFVFGYQLAVISGALLSIRREFALSAFEQGALVAVLPLGAMAGGLAAGGAADRLGRRRTLFLTGILFAATTLLAVVAQSYGVLLAARAITGVAVGAASSVVPLYLSELAPPALRGRLVSLNQLMVTVGIVAAYCVNLAFASSGDWRAMFAVGLVPVAALLIGLLRAPESPVWIAAQGGREDGRGRSDVWGLMRSAARPALMVGVTLAALQQFSGINAVIFFAPSIMEDTGLSASNSILYSVIVGVVNVGATVLSMRLVDGLGRRPLLIASLAGMTVSLALLGLTFEVPLGAADSVLSLLCLLGFIAAFALGVGPIFWLLIAEIFPPRARATGASVSTAANWFFNFVVSLAFLPVVAAIGQGATFWVFAAVSMLGIAFVNRYVPETKGRSFDEIENDVRQRWYGLPREGAAAY